MSGENVQHKIHMWQRHHRESNYIHVHTHGVLQSTYLHLLMHIPLHLTQARSFNAQCECVLVHVFKLGTHNTITCSVSLYNHKELVYCAAHPVP